MFVRFYKRERERERERERAYFARIVGSSRGIL